MKSIKVKLWLAIVGITVLVSVVIWICQVTLLEQSYLSNKKDEILQHTAQISQLLETKGIVFATVEIDQIALENNYSIEIYVAGAPPFTSQPAGSRNILEGRLKERTFILHDLRSYGGGIRLYPGPITDDGLSSYIGASLQYVDGAEHFTLVASTLAPVKEALFVIQRQLLLITIILIVLASLIAFVIAHSISKPISRLTHATQQLARGNLGIRVTVTGRDEIARLGENFNIMSLEIARANKLQRELVANLSHDIRTPLTMIKGYAETIRDLTLDNTAKAQQQLEIIIQETDRLNTLVTDILALSQLQAGRLQLTYTQFDFSKVLSDVLKRYQLLIIQEGFQFELHCPPEVTITADQNKMEQVIYNLINNATNHTGADKKIIITVEEQQDCILFRVQDTGVGIPAEHLPLIWDRYYKPYKKNDRKGMGTGLGLSIVKEILLAHEYAFGVDSLVGQGSTFWVQLKRSE